MGIKSLKIQQNKQSETEIQFFESLLTVKLFN